jgi:hypothetical protein
VKAFWKKIEPHLVEDYKDAVKWLSVWAMATTAAMVGAWQAVPDSWKEVVPDKWKTAAVIVMMVLGVAGRVLKQGGGDAGSAT